MAVTCPCCGQPLKEPLDVMALSSRIGAHPNTKTEQLVRALVSRYPAGCTNAELTAAAHGGSDAAPMSAENGVSVLIWRLRKRMRLYGWTIAGAYRDGQYRLVRL